MAEFKKKDREKRSSQKALHASAMKFAEEVWYYSDELNPVHQMTEAYQAYHFKMRQLGGQPVTRESFEKRFKP